MKLRIISKKGRVVDWTSPNGEDLKLEFYDLFCSFNQKEIYEQMKEALRLQGATEERIDGFLKENEYNGYISYQLNVGCSKYTFERVEAKGVLDAEIVLNVNDRGFINAKIRVHSGRERVLSYNPPNVEVTGWTSEPAPIVTETPPLPTLENTPPKNDEVDDLPF